MTFILIGVVGILNWDVVADIHSPSIDAGTSGMIEKVVLSWDNPA
jgi:hypothetical protein